ncbi:hypothetical protein NK358_27365 [Bacillus sp. S0635]|uniref:hypothetical protein n=1 Tax=Bacillus TaxID=1386 RepID=UPI0020A07937|nr:hypothetical protein [Bacillus sp. S0635]MCP1285343.1 hypothetical protein [Bacillus sp. S0635]
MKVDSEDLQKAFELFREACEVIVQWFKQTWEQIKEIALNYIKYKSERSQRPAYGYVKYRVMKSQVLNRKPKCIRARSVC